MIPVSILFMSINFYLPKLSTLPLEILPMQFLDQIITLLMFSLILTECEVIKQLPLLLELIRQTRSNSLSYVILLK
ncbi:hypothetical protein ES706_04097 [subsurface metagenome]